MHLQVCDQWPVASGPFFGLPRVRRVGTLASVGGRVVGTGVCSTGWKVNCRCPLGHVRNRGGELG